jgi:acyl-CoA thioester hydrolase
MSTTPKSPPRASVRIKLRWRDVDMLGHVNQSVYHEYTEEARTALLASLPGADSKGGWVLVHTDLDHRHEIRRDADEVECTAWIDAVGTKSVTFRNEVRTLDGTLCAEGSSVIVAWDPATRGAREMEPAERAGFLGEDAPEA